MEHTVTITQNANEVIIGNDYLSRVFSTKGKKLLTSKIVNHRTDGLDTVFAPAGESEEFLIAFTTGKLMKTSSLTLEGMDTSSLPEGGQRVVFRFHEKHGWQIQMYVEMLDGDHFMRKYLKLRANERASKYKIDYIDLERMMLGKTVINHWAKPNNMEDGIIDGYRLSLGQPFYINGMFFGCEFPGTDNGIVGERAFIRYYSGKDFKSLAKTEDGAFTTFKTVAGAARSVDFEVIRTDFFEYIESIAAPCDFRKQYNSWYDHMLNISSKNIERSFYEIEKGLTQHGVEPLDAYVVDDGWVDYDADFWRFNSKFPNELYDSSELAHKFSSEFGLWLGPRGGYNYMDTFAKHIEKAGNGAYNSRGREVCINHSVYQQKIKELFLDYMDKFDIGYWKLDGFAHKCCRGKHHGHMVGGEHDMYYTTEQWEHWTEIFSAMREHRAAQGKDLWINFTCYAPPSPWFLQWVNTMWLQNCGDIGFAKEPKAQVDQMLNYRDGRYFDFLAVREFQYPLAHIYNHEPIYGNSAKIHMDTEEFRTYLYMLATRGTAFWELYFSYNMMDDDKWAICAEVLAWAKKNFPILRNAKLVGKTPDEGNVYGYSSWILGQGILALRNPTDQPKSYTVTLDRLIGVREGMFGLYKSTVLPYTTEVDEKAYQYGDKITVELKPYEAVIWQFSAKNTTPPALLYAKTTGVSTIELSFDKTMAVLPTDFTVEGNEVTAAALKADFKTVVLTVKTPFAPNTPIQLHATAHDVEGLQASDDFLLYYDADTIIASVESTDGLLDAEPVIQKQDDALAAPVLELSGTPYRLNTKKCVQGIADFTVSLLVKAQPASHGCLAQQQGAWSLCVKEDGRLVFEVNGLSLISKAKVTDGGWKKINAVREKNGMLKLYIGDELDCSVYDPATPMALPTGELSIGGDGFSGSLSLLKIKNTATSFDELLNIEEVGPVKLDFGRVKKVRKFFGLKR